MPERSYEGGCLCGAVRYRVSGPVTNLCYCHCKSCRGASGAHCVAWGSALPERFELLRGELRVFRSSPPVERGFCAGCGTALCYRHAGRPRELDFTLASLDDSSGLAPDCHIWVSHQLPWVVLSDGLPQHAEWRRQTEA